MRLRITLCLFLCIISTISLDISYASVFDFGAGRWGVENIVGASIEGNPVWAYFNPASITSKKGHLELMLGTGGFVSGFNRSKSISGNSNLFGLGLVIPLRLQKNLKNRITLGFLMTTPFTIHMIMQTIDEPRFLYFQDRLDRIMLIPAISIKLLNWLTLGLSINYGTFLNGWIDVRTAYRGGFNPWVEEDFGGTVSSIFGLLLTKWDLNIGLSYRHMSWIPIENMVLVDYYGDRITFGLMADTFYTPSVYRLSVSKDLKGDFKIALDIQYQRWSLYDGGVLNINAYVTDVISSRLKKIDTLPDEISFRDIIIPGFGIWWHGDIGGIKINTQIGYAYVPGFTTEATSPTLIDNNKHIIGLGIGIERSGFGLSIGAQGVYMEPFRPSVSIDNAVPISKQDLSFITKSRIFGVERVWAEGGFIWITLSAGLK